MCEVNENRLDGSAGKVNFKMRRRTRSRSDSSFVFGTCLLFISFSLLFNFACANNDRDVLTLQDNLEIDNDSASDRRRPTNGQEKDILLLDALARRKGSYQHNGYGSSQEDDSIMDLLGKSELRIL